MASNITERDANSPSGDGRVDQYTEGHPDQAGLSQQQATPAPHTVGYRSTYFGTGTTQEAEVTDDASAATALMQLQASERNKSYAHVTDRSEEGPHTQRSAPDMTHFYTHRPTRLYQSRSDTGPVQLGMIKQEIMNSTLHTHHKVTRIAKIAWYMTLSQI